MIAILFFNTCSFFHAAMGAGQAAALMPDAQKAQYATRSIFALLDRAPPIDCDSPSGSPAALAGADVEFENVGFAYPTRPDVSVFKNVSFTVKAGQKVALVGQVRPRDMNLPSVYYFLLILQRLNVSVFSNCSYSLSTISHCIFP